MARQQGEDAPVCTAVGLQSGHIMNAILLQSLPPRAYIRIRREWAQLSNTFYQIVDLNASSRVGGANI